VLLTLWRHGEAGSAATDELRALTPRGHEQVVAMAQHYAAWAGESGLGPVSLLLHSPYQRTVETAALLGELLRPGSQKVDPSLAPGAYPEAFSENDYPGQEHIIMVSHQPFVSQAIAVWVDTVALAPLAPGGYSTLEVTCLARGGATLLRHCPDPWDLASKVKI
jgi:phosphohistidine phosphatase SixA